MMTWMIIDYIDGLSSIDDDSITNYLLIIKDENVLVQSSARNPHDFDDVDNYYDTFENLTPNFTNNKLNYTDDKLTELNDGKYESNDGNKVNFNPLKGFKRLILNRAESQDSINFLLKTQEEIFFEKCINYLKLLKKERKLIKSEQKQLKRENKKEKLTNSNTFEQGSKQVNSLVGSEFWSDYYKSLKNAFNQQKQQLGHLISEGCYNLDTQTLCTKCKYNHIKQCIDITNSKSTKPNLDNCLDITITHKKTNKVIDSFSVNLTPETDNKGITKFVNNIKISVKSNLGGTMDTYDLTNTDNTTVNMVDNPEINSTNKTTEFNLNDYYMDQPDNETSSEDVNSEPDMNSEVSDLLESGIKLHAFKINNRGVNLPLFLNIGNPDSVYSGQGFVSSDSIGLFKIAVVEAVEPKKTLLDKVRNAIPFELNNSNCPCKCTNQNSCKPFTTSTILQNYRSDGVSNDGVGVFNSLIKSIMKFTGIPLLNTNNTNVSEIVNENVCLFHRNLITEVDRKRFGKDVYCRMKYFGSVSSDKPVRVLDHTLTIGSRVSSFFNGLYQQLLCVSGEDPPEDCEHLKHKYTFIIRSLKGKRYGRNFTILNTTSGEHLCLDLLTHELRFARENHFSKLFVPAIFKILPLKTVVSGVITDAFNCYYTYYRVVSSAGKRFKLANKVFNLDHEDNEDQSEVKRELLCPNNLSTTDQFINIST
ncbi:uncharacterized protein TA08270 [Theileria annulata]|uniref:Uncharacterized protein n=1 Tax=Theileria annulata TaxID=5874 RepID=Q4U9Q7_THEAN|nr:uncharacterized protein TA08270 [Theileria annulata]CAI76446.1 hypothetical protein TA08270 [Theileria annulata]|eukprot:XP_953071.1 hypothetical protein TA08270 [Theileria annulata]